MDATHGFLNDRGTCAPPLRFQSPSNFIFTYSTGMFNSCQYNIST